MEKNIREQKIEELEGKEARLSGLECEDIMITEELRGYEQENQR